MRFIVIVGLLLSTFVANAQRYATQSGAWTAAIWATTPGGVPGSAATPTSTDDVYTNGRNVTVSSAATCRNLFVSYNVANSIAIGASRSIIITGALLGWDDANAVEEFQVTANALTFANANSRLEFNAVNLASTIYDPYLIDFWDETIPMRNLRFNLGVLSKSLILPIAVTGEFRVQSGTLTMASAAAIYGQTTSSFLIDAGATIITSDPITNFLNATLSGTLTTSNFVNISNSFTLSAGANFNTSYNNVAGGWWSGSSPTTNTIDPTSTINFNLNGTQNISPLTYGNITLSGTGTISKILSGSGTLIVAGTLSISSSGITFNSNAASAVSIGGSVINAGTWTPIDLVSFNGTNGQSISGTSTITFSGGLDINKSAGTLTLNRAINIANGLTISQGTLNLGSQTVTLTSGNIDNDGTFTVGSSTFVVNGTTAITGSSPVSFNNLTIGGSGSLSTSGTINIAGDLTNTGTLSATTVAFNGSAAQNINGTGALTNINVTNTAGVTNNGTINLTGILTLSGGGVFDTDGSGSGVFNIVSNDLTSNAGIATLSTPSDLSGEIAVQRFVNGPDDWRYFSVPVTSATVSMWQDDFPVTGNFSNPSPNGIDGVVSSTAPSIFRFDAPTQAYVAIGTGASTGATALSSNIGYSAYTYLTGNFTIDITGTPTKGNVNVALSASGAGWNLVPNPYPSPIDWDNVNRTGTSGSMYMTTGQGSFATYLAGSGTCTGCESFNSGWRGEVAIGQSFWIESTGSTSLALTESAKTTNSATFVREDEESVNLFRVTLKSLGKEDDLIIHFNEEASYATELNFDAKKRLNDYYLNLSSYNTNPEEHYAINGLPLATCDGGTVKLKMSNLTVGEHLLSFTELDKLNLGYTITLTDNFLSTEMVIGNNDVYTFQTTADAESTADGRFELRFESPSIQIVASSSLSVESTCESNLLNVDILNSQQGVSYQFFKGDSPVSDLIHGNGGELNTIVPKSLLSAGINGLNLKASTLDGCQSTTFDNIVSYELVNVPQVLSVTGASVCNIGNATITALGSPEAVAYRWYDSQLNDADFVQTVGNSLIIEDASESRDYYVSTLNKNGCESLTRTLVSINVTEIITPVASLNGTTLLSNSEFGNQWYKDGEPIPGAVSSSYEVTETGVYTVEVTVNTCSAVSNEITVAITGLEFGNEQALTAYPNPVNDWLTIKIPADVVSTIRTLNLVDARGAVISSYNPSEMSSGAMSINMTEQSKGLYYLDIRTANRTLVYRIIKN